jgi:hypothetical protein
MKWVGIAVVIVAVVLAAFGLVYLFVPAHSLPSVLGGTRFIARHKVFYRSRRGEVLMIAAALLLIGAGLGYVFHRDVWSRPPAGAA